jgi:hypothetical protein
MTTIFRSRLTNTQIAIMTPHVELAIQNTMLRGYGRKWQIMPHTRRDTRRSKKYQKFSFLAHPLGVK